jgi:hypothetical protein
MIIKINMVNAGNRVKREPISNARRLIPGDYDKRKTCAVGDWRGRPNSNAACP